MRTFLSLLGRGNYLNCFIVCSDNKEQLDEVEYDIMNYQTEI